jgi:hypothetical protein
VVGKAGRDPFRVRASSRPLRATRKGWRLAAKGGCEPQLDVHLHAARNVGLTIEELREVLIQVAPYAGFPAAMNAMRRLQALEAEHAADEPAP